MRKNIPFQLDVFLGDILVAVSLSDEFAAFAVDKQHILPVHGLDRAQALIIGEVINRAVCGDIARVVIAVGGPAVAPVLWSIRLNQTTLNSLILH